MELLREGCQSKGGIQTRRGIQRRGGSEGGGGTGRVAPEEGSVGSGCRTTSGGGPAVAGPWMMDAHRELPSLTGAQA